MVKKIYFSTLILGVVLLAPAFKSLQISLNEEGGGECYSYHSCEGFEFTNSFYVRDLKTSLSCAAPTMGQPCAMTFEGYVKESF